MIKLNFCDMDRMFDYNDNFILDIANKKFGGYEISDTPDFLIYSVFGINHLRYKNCVKIFITNEAVTPDFNECDYAIGFDRISFGDRYIRRPVWFYEERFYNNRLVITDDEALNRKFCNFIFYNDQNGEGSLFRQEMVKRLSEYKRVDCPGKVLNNMKAPELIGRFDGDWRRSKVDFIKNYKFTFAFENTSVIGYTTEKIIHPLVAKSVPIYWGNPDVELDFNSKAFVNCNNFEDIDAIVEKIIELDNDAEQYLEMLHAEPMSEYYNPNDGEEMLEFFAHIFSKGNSPYHKDPRNWCKRMSVDNLPRREKIKYFLFR